MKGIIGLDIGGTKCAVLIASVEDEIRILEREQFDTPKKGGFPAAYEKLCEGIERLAARNRQVEPAGIGVSCGGPLDSRRGVILSPPNLPGWDEIYLPRMLRERYGLPAFIMNDANACALTEWKLGAGRGTQDMVFLTMGTGMGAGIIAGGRLLIGASDMAGEVGHIRLSDDGPIGFGKAGSFEGFCSGGGIARLAQAAAREAAAGGAPLDFAPDEERILAITARSLAEAAKGGSEAARAIYAQVGARLGQGIALLCDLLNPECVVIGSIFVRAQELLRPSMERVLEREALCHSRRVLRVVPAQTGEALGDLASIMTAVYNLGLNLE